MLSFQRRTRWAFASMPPPMGSMDLSVKDGGLPPDSVVQPIDVILKESEKAVKKFHDPKPYAMHRVALAPCSPFSVSEELLRQSAMLARQLGVRLHTHLAETKDEERYLLETRGIRPLAYMEELGWVGSDVWYAHGITSTTTSSRCSHPPKPALPTVPSAT